MTRLPLVALSGARPDDASDAELVAAAAAGQRWASEALFRRHFTTATRLAWRLAPKCDAEDVAQDALVEALMHLQRLTSPSGFTGWLRGIVVRLVRGRLRRRGILSRLLRNMGRYAPPLPLAAGSPQLSLLPTPH